jgi:ribosomal protein L37AE/L43A
MILRSFGGGAGGDLRRPAVNIISPSQPPLDQSRYCPRCNLQLSYLEKEEIWCCVKCGWNIPDELLKSPKQQQHHHLRHNDNMPALTGTRNESSSSSSSNIQEEDIAIVSKGRRSDERKRDPLDYLRKDDAPLLEKGWTLVSERIDLPTGGDTLSSEDLTRETKRRTNGIRW